MAFYIKPPDGFGSLGKLRLYALRRINFLVEVLKCADAVDFQELLEKGATAVDSDCLIEGSRKDRISHFLLRLICCADAELSTCMLKAETELFCHRFASMNSDELLKFLKTTYRFLRRLHRHHGVEETSPSKPTTRVVFSSISRSQGAYSAAVDNLLEVLSLILDAAGSWDGVVKLYMDYSLNVFSIPFQHALCLVASRQVMMDRGTAFVPFSNLHVVLAAMFEDILREGIRVAHQVPHHFLEDARMKSISREVRAAFMRAHIGFRNKMVPISGNGSVVREYQIDDLHRVFPPCMSHLHRTLRRKHRLRHFSRIQYTLFLKSIGLPVGDAIHFWRSEYSKPSPCHDDQGGGCQHSWSKDERRYTYSIRHLYGLEGSKTDYRAHSCNTIQTMQLGYGEEGGCPFKHFDDYNFERMMDIEEIVGPAREEISLERQKGKFNAACKKYFNAKLSWMKIPCENSEIAQSGGSLKTKACHGVGSTHNSSNRYEIQDDGHCADCGVQTFNGLDTSSTGRTQVRSSDDKALYSARKKMTNSYHVNSIEKSSNDIQHTIHANENAENSNHERSRTAMYPLEMGCTCGVSSLNVSCHMTKGRTRVTDSDISCQCATGQATLLQHEPQTSNTNPFSGLSSVSTNSVTAANVTMSPNKISGKALKRESAIVSMKDRKVAKTMPSKKESAGSVSLVTLGTNQNEMNLRNSLCKSKPELPSPCECTMTAEYEQHMPTLKPSSEDLESMIECKRTKHYANEKEDARVHESKSGVAPSFGSDLALNPLSKSIKGELSSNKLHRYEDLGFTSELDRLSILRPSDFYYSFDRMISGLNQNKH